jgi:mono/diheme cytochrome c family protein
MKRMLLSIALTMFAAAGLSAQDAKKAAAGKSLYDKNGCAKCHQIAGKGSKMSPLDGVGSKLSAAEIKQWLTDPAAMTAKLPKKPAATMKKVDLPDADLDNLVHYMLSLKK